MHVKKQTNNACQETNKRIHDFQPWLLSWAARGDPLARKDMTQSKSLGESGCAVVEGLWLSVLKFDDAKIIPMIIKMGFDKFQHVFWLARDMLVMSRYSCCLHILACAGIYCVKLEQIKLENAYVTQRPQCAMNFCNTEQAWKLVDGFKGREATDIRCSTSCKQTLATQQTGHFTDQMQFPNDLFFLFAASALN